MRVSGVHAGVQVWNVVPTGGQPCDRDDEVLIQTWIQSSAGGHSEFQTWPRSFDVRRREVRLDLS